LTKPENPFKEKFQTAVSKMYAFSRDPNLQEEYLKTVNPKILKKMSNIEKRMLGFINS